VLIVQEVAADVTGRVSSRDDLIPGLISSTRMANSKVTQYNLRSTLEQLEHVRYSRSVANDLFTIATVNKVLTKNNADGVFSLSNQPTYT